MNSVLFDAWASCGDGQCDTSKFYLSVKERSSKRCRGTRRWLLFHEMVERFTEPVAAAMRENKLNDATLFEKEVRYHPELPHKEDWDWGVDSTSS